MRPAIVIRARSRRDCWRACARAALFYGADDILAPPGSLWKTTSLLQLALADPGRHDDRAEAAASVLGPRLWAAWLTRSSTWDRACAWMDNRTALRAKLYGLEIASGTFPARVLLPPCLRARRRRDNEQMGRLAELLSRHPGETDRGRPYDPASLAAIQGLVEDWGGRMLASGDSERWHTASVAKLASRAPSVTLLPILKRLLDDNLRRFRAFRKEAAALGWRQGKALDEARTPMTHDISVRSWLLRRRRPAP